MGSSLAGADQLFLGVEHTSLRRPKGRNIPWLAPPDIQRPARFGCVMAFASSLPPCPAPER